MLLAALSFIRLCVFLCTRSTTIPVWEWVNTAEMFCSPFLVLDPLSQNPSLSGEGPLISPRECRRLGNLEGARTGMNDLKWCDVIDCKGKFTGVNFRSVKDPFRFLKHNTQGRNATTTTSHRPVRDVRLVESSSKYGESASQESTSPQKPPSLFNFPLLPTTKRLEQSNKSHVSMRGRVSDPFRPLGWFYS